jgi:hypothetical protein
MGNISSRPTNRLGVLIEETKDFSFNLSSNISQVAEQNIVASQSQNVEISVSELENCPITITQNMTILASQIAVFKAVFTNPTELVKMLTKGRNSMLEQSINSNSPVMQDFVSTMKDKFKTPTNSAFRAKITSIFKANIDQNSIQRCTQNIFTNQEQRVKILGEKCKDSKITIAQDMVIDAAQNCVFEVTMNALMEDPTMRMAVRQFNGDYDKGFLNEQLDAGARIPDVCFNANKTVYRTDPCSSQSSGSNPTSNVSSTYKSSTISSDKKKFPIVILYTIIILILIIFYYYYVYKK